MGRAGATQELGGEEGEEEEEEGEGEEEEEEERNYRVTANARRACDDGAPVRENRPEFGSSQPRHRACRVGQFRQLMNSSAPTTKKKEWKDFFELF
jgi:hypothetical protein